MTTGLPAFKLLEIAAAGTFGTVCVVRDLDRGTLIALKVLKEAHLHRPRVIARTHDEAAMLSRIDHPGIVKVNGLLELEGRPVLAMEWVRGLSLEGVLQACPHGLPLPEAVEIVRHAALALGAAYHACPGEGQAPMRIIHRDVKPSNMLMSVDGEVKVVDFGIARCEIDGKAAKTLSMVLGARGYLAPERLDGHEDKPSCDIYSLGVMLFELITGRHMMLSVHRRFHTEALDRHVAGLRPKGLSEDAIAELQDIVASMCRYDETVRPDHETLVHRLTHFLRHNGLRPDLRGWGRRELLPMFRDRHRVRPIDHPSYPRLAFLERAARHVRFPAPPDVDQELRVFLRNPGWPTMRDELEVLLIKNPHWSEAPFLEKLPSGSRSWWQFWGGEELDDREIVAILEVLRRRPTPAVVQRVEHLKRHSNPEIALAARALLEPHEFRAAK